MARFVTSSSFSLSGDGNMSLASLMAAPEEGSKDIATLSTVNYPTAGSSLPNATNQQVFMNQPLSWWVEGLNAGTIQYTPVSGDVNWAYTAGAKDASGNFVASGSPIHIGTSITNSLIPNRTKSVSRNATTGESTVVYEPKVGISRTDIHKM